ncbi:hypothetical protein I7I51_00252 [Histoplasma capsulatum]|uniref:Uncharacterized protein n=1 Tax=Ajellomyces capsulatus TaxID=5037 RepID=A0A8A1MBI9_AJECA|nr:hypothetical protein I7I51_00252 [Histoplasma capsulatum]
MAGDASALSRKTVQSHAPRNRNEALRLGSGIQAGEWPVSFGLGNQTRSPLKNTPGEDCCVISPGVAGKLSVALTKLELRYSPQHPSLLGVKSCVQDASGLCMEDTANHLVTILGSVR